MSDLAKFEGRCRCGAVRYAIAAPLPPPVYCCHCLDCQRTTGSAFAVQAIVMRHALTVAGEVIGFSLAPPAGGTSTHQLCPTCHTRLWTTNSARPMIAIVRAGTLDDTSALAPRAHIWTSRRQGWVVMPPGVAAYAENAPDAEFVALMMRPAP